MVAVIDYIEKNLNECVLIFNHVGDEKAIDFQSPVRGYKEEYVPY